MVEQLSVESIVPVGTNANSATTYVEVIVFTSDLLILPSQTVTVISAPTTITGRSFVCTSSFVCALPMILTCTDRDFRGRRFWSHGRNSTPAWDLQAARVVWIRRGRARDVCYFAEYRKRHNFGGRCADLYLH
jgi:hypothetical protein